MKKLLLFCFTSLVLRPVIAQDFNTARHRYKDRTSNMVSINSKSFYVESSEADSLNLVAIGAGGQTLFKTKLNNGYGIYTPVKIIKTLDKKLIVLSIQREACDVASYTSTISKCDTNGLLIFQLFYGQNIPGAVVSDITQHPDSSFYQINAVGSDIRHYSKTGAGLPGITSVFSVMNSITALSNGNLLVNGVQNGVLKNVELSTTGAIISQQNTSFTITSLTQSPSGRLYGLETNGSICTFSSNLQPLNSSMGATGQNMRIQDFKVRNDTVFCTGNLIPFSMPYYAILAPNLNLLYQTQSSYKGITPTGITINTNNRVSIISIGTSNNNNPLTFTGLFQTAATGSFASGGDVGVIGHSALAATAYPGIFSFGGYYTLSTNLAVQVKNFGTDTVKSFYLNQFNGEICSASFHKKYTATIAPNSVITVTTGLFTTTFIPPGNLQGTTYTVQVCLNTTVPNFVNDLTIDNDSWCGPVAVMIPLGIHETGLDNYSIQVYPNPVQRSFTLEADARITKIEVMTIGGATIYSDNSYEPATQIETEKWPSGLYFIKIETEKGSTLKKMIKN